ncbi:hypothetical protein [Pseudoneobacillus sp. C159]
MEKQVAVEIANFIDLWSESLSVVFEIEKLAVFNDRLLDFHQWTNGKPVLAAYRVSKIGDQALYFLLIDWHRNNQYYLVIYAGNKATTLAEIRQVVEHEERHHLYWKYNPLKRDGKNQERKAFFTQIFGTTSLYIPLPTSCMEVDEFFTRLFQLSSQREKADRIVDTFQMDDF